MLDIPNLKQVRFVPIIVVILLSFRNLTFDSDYKVKEMISTQGAPESIQKISLYPPIGIFIEVF